MTDAGRFDPRAASTLIAVAVLCGIVLHAADQLLHARAGPVPVVVTAPAVAVLTYRYLHPEPRLRWLLALLCWSALGTGVAVLGAFVAGTTYRLPRPMTGTEMVLYDLGLFLWFVLSVPGAFALVARRTDRRRYVTAAALLGPVLQFGWVPLFVGLVELATVL